MISASRGGTTRSARPARIEATIPSLDRTRREGALTVVLVIPANGELMRQASPAARPANGHDGRARQAGPATRPARVGAADRPGQRPPAAAHGGNDFESFAAHAGSPSFASGSPCVSGPDSPLRPVDGQGIVSP